MTLQTVQFLADVAAFGEHRSFLRDARGIDSRGAQQISEPRFQPARKRRTQLYDQPAHLVRLLADSRQPRTKLFREVTSFDAPHLIQLSQRFAEAPFQLASEFLLLLFRFGQCRGQPADHAGQP